jgi:hypothetical protein
VYAVEEGSGKRFLVRLECDHGDCDATIKPHPEIASSGWTKRGGRDSAGFTWENTYCPRHS